MRTFSENVAQGLLEAALSYGFTSPDLDSEQLDMLLELAAVEQGGEMVYTAESLRRVVVTGWRWKAARVADTFELGGGAGVYLKRQHQYDHYIEIADNYGSGKWSVDGTSPLGDDVLPGTENEDPGTIMLIQHPVIVRN